MQKTSSRTDDIELVRKALSEPDDYAAIVERYNAPLLRYVNRLGCRNKDDAEDVLQEALIKAYVNLNSYDQELKFSSWLYRIVHNETMTYFRRASVRPQPAVSEDQLLFLENVSDDWDLESDADKRFLAEDVSKALESLEDKYRDPLILRFLEDKSYEEISDILKLPIGTVATLISRGKERLREQLGAVGVAHVS